MCAAIWLAMQLSTEINFNGIRNHPVFFTNVSNIEEDEI
jgi:hypothetical protein